MRATTLVRVVIRRERDGKMRQFRDNSLTGRLGRSGCRRCGLLASGSAARRSPVLAGGHSGPHHAACSEDPAQSILGGMPSQGVAVGSKCCRVGKGVRLAPCPTRRAPLVGKLRFAHSVTLLYERADRQCGNGPDGRRKPSWSTEAQTALDSRQTPVFCTVLSFHDTSLRHYESIMIEIICGI